MEQLRTVLFLGGLTALLIAIGALIGGTNGMIIALVFAIIINGFSYFFSDKLVLWMYKAKPLVESTADGQRCHALVRKVSTMMKIPMPKLFFVEEQSPNAFATGRDPHHAAVVFTRGILGLLNDTELEGVIAHELSHVKNRDVLIASIAAVIAGAIGSLAHMLMWTGMGGGDREGRNPIGIILIAISIPIIALLIQLAVSRSREYHA
ncbi:MAG: M48 family metalloprotease, partial [archaeon]